MTNELQMAITLAFTAFVALVIGFMFGQTFAIAYLGGVIVGLILPYFNSLPGSKIANNGGMT